MLLFSSNLLKIKKFLVLLLFIFSSVFLLSLNPQHQSALKNKVIAFLLPSHRVTSKIGANPFGLKKQEINIEKLQKSNRMLLDRLSNFEAKRHIWQELIKENKRLIALLGFQKKSPLELVSAEIIGRDPTNWNKVIFINKGLTDGLKRNFPVITAEGLVGQIIELTSHQAKVMTILDNNSRVAALIDRNRTQGIIIGTNDVWCRLNYVSLRENPEEEDLVITSGQGGIFPKGLIIGKIESIKKREIDLFQKIKINPTVNFSRLEELMVIIKE